MTTKRYSGSCHCGAVRYEADIDLEAGTSRCNCRFCQKTRNRGVIIKPEAFTLLTDEAALSDYVVHGGAGHQLFCSTCGVRTFSHGHIEELGGAFVSVAVGSLDIDQEAFGQIPYAHLNGRDDDWFNVPAVTSHL